VSAGGANRSIDRSATNLETAIAQALRTFDPRYLKRLVLITDGNENSGDIMKILGRAQEAGVRIFAMPATVRGAGDSWIETIDLPDGIREQEPVLATVQVFSRVATTATVELRGDDVALETREVDLQPGLNPIEFEVRLTGEGPVTISGRLQTADDPFPQNDVLLQSITVGPRPRILYIEGRATSAHYLYDALTDEGMEVELGQARDLPTAPKGATAFGVRLLDRLVADHYEKK